MPLCSDEDEEDMDGSEPDDDEEDMEGSEPDPQLDENDINHDREDDDDVDDDDHDDDYSIVESAVDAMDLLNGHCVRTPLKPTRYTHEEKRQHRYI